jgi:IS30 family transposase
MEREEISRGIGAGGSLRTIAAALGRSPSTVTREVNRNGGRGAYRAAAAQERADRTALRPKPCRLALYPDLRRFIAEKLSLLWSPEQISATLKTRFPDDETMRASHETIYKSLFIQARGVLKAELLKALRSKRVMRRAHGAKSRAMTRSLIPDAISIRERPAEADDRAVPGHWEGDLLMGGTDTRIATLVERTSRFVMLVRLQAKTSVDVAAALARQVQTLPAQAMRSLTWDRGSEMAAHAGFTMATDVAVYFCDPYSPWQRGSNENTNGLLRQYFPKGCNFNDFTQDQLDDIAAALNQRPRKTLGFDTPANVFAKSVALTG